MNNVQKVTVIGAGSWGSTLGHVLADNGHDVLIWTRREDQANEINQKHTNANYLPGENLSKNLKATASIDEAVAFSNTILVVIPTAGMRAISQMIAEKATEPKTIIHASKGLEQETHLRISEVIEQEIPAELLEAVVVLSGPSHAEELIRKGLTSVTVASKNEAATKKVQYLFMNEYFRIYTHSDVMGVELGGALKNIIALASGILAGISFGDNAKAALVTRGLYEIHRLGVALGADADTFFGLSGMGDLIVTAMSAHSRNYQFGILIGEGMTVDEALGEVSMVVEGFYTTRAAYELSKEIGVEMPITESLYRVLYDGAEVKQELSDLMAREAKSEWV